MREIKYRCWNPEINEMLLQPLDGLNAVSRLLGFADTIRGAEVMQYTGLKDSKGVEIYEGDLVRIPAECEYEEKTYNCFEVFYHDNECIGGQNIGFCINRMHPQGHSAGGYGFKFTPESMNKFEIIGNIFEHPELINPN